MNREQKKRAKQTDVYRARHKRSVLLIILWIAVSLVLGFTIFPVAGAIGLFLWPVVVLASLIKSHFLLKTIVSQMKEDSPDTDSNRRVTMQQRQPESDQRQQSLNNPIVNAAASYAVGKAVTDNLKKTPIAKNPNTERYQAYMKAASSRENLSESAAHNRQIVKLKNGRGGYLFTMPNGAQKLVDYRNSEIARYDPIHNKTTAGLKDVGKGKLISTFLA